MKGQPRAMKSYIIYLTKNKLNGKIYVGAHETENLDGDDYLGSGNILKRAISRYGVENFERETLYVCSSREHMYDCEALLVTDEFIKNKKLVYNIKCGGNGGWGGKIPVIDNITGEQLLCKPDDENYVNGQYVTISTGKLTVVDTLTGRTFQCSKDDPKYLDGTYVSFFKNRVNVIDPVTGKCVQISKDDPEYINGTYISISQNTHNFIDPKTGKTVKLHSSDPNYHNPEFKSINCGKFPVLDTLTGERLQCTSNDPNFISGRYVHPAKNNIIVKNVETGKWLSIPKGCEEYKNGIKSGKYITSGMGKITVRDTITGKTLQCNKDDPNFLNGTYISIHKGKHSYIDIETGETVYLSKSEVDHTKHKSMNSGKFIVTDTLTGVKLHCTKDDPNFISGRYVSIAKNKVRVRDVETGKTVSLDNRSDDYINGLKSGKYESSMKNIVTVRNTLTGKTLQCSKDDPKYLDGTYVSVNTGTIVVGDETGKWCRVHKSDERLLSGAMWPVERLYVEDKDGNRFQITKYDKRFIDGTLTRLINKRTGKPYKPHKK